MRFLLFSLLLGISGPCLYGQQSSDTVAVHNDALVDDYPEQGRNYFVKVNFHFTT